MIDWVELGGIFVNSNEPGHAVEEALEAQALDLADKAVKSAIDAAASGVGLSAVQVGALAAPLTGSLLGILIDQLHGIVEDECDGTVAIEQYVRRGDELQKMTIGGQPVQMAVGHEGEDSPTLCGANSEYTVAWSIRQATE